ncbi:hypothetical protein BN874_1850033 [Candidatus Contendobacter odensis Run_B_J11]|uniref:Uncharacterized protein n=1 Tax=Candidatus Contendobacter odensis Run_B_J11 TaxID=1400861 RepID=A0A7U7GA51_9GAMM|nr:hypothetical protein BN874_1850033 [Candidatus Contendobacter odensis Run_B_J11]
MFVEFANFGDRTGRSYLSGIVGGHLLDFFLISTTTRILYLVALLLWLAGGKARLKAEVARRVELIRQSCRSINRC